MDFSGAANQRYLRLGGCSHPNRYRDRYRYRYRSPNRSPGDRRPISHAQGQLTFLLLSIPIPIAISISMPHPISESKEREFENRRRTAVCGAYRATPWRATEEGPGCVSHGGQTAPPPYACGKARRTAARLHKQAYIPAVSGDRGPSPSSLESGLSQKPLFTQA